VGFAVITMPIPIVQVDVARIAELVVTKSVDGSRVWVEVSREGQVVGIVEMVTRDGRISANDIRQRTEDLEAVTPSIRVDVPMEELPRMSVVVPTICKNPLRLQSTIDRLMSLNYPSFDIIVVDNRPDPNRSPLPDFGSDSRVYVFWEPHRGVSAARNCGFGNATGDFVAFTDDDAEVDVNWLLEMGLRFVASPTVDGIGGLVLPMELRTAPQLWFEEFFGGFNQSFSAELMSMELLADDPLFPYATGRYGAGVNMAIRRSAFIAIGGFDETLGVGTPSRGGEDLSLFMRLVLSGGTVAFEPRAVVRHQHRETETEFFDQVFGYGTGLTAMFTALIISDPRHVPKMIRRLPRAFRLLTEPRDERSPSSRASYPRRTYTYHLLGMAYGPIAYVRSVVRTRKERSSRTANKP
jgi:glycosyltransferase involved in cell wall biosynthesis